MIQRDVTFRCHSYFQHKMNLPLTVHEQWQK
jgi:hypothetical protein